jgi:hypothetical protein
VLERYSDTREDGLTLANFDSVRFRILFALLIYPLLDMSYYYHYSTTYCDDNFGCNQYYLVADVAVY